VFQTSWLALSLSCSLSVSASLTSPLPTALNKIFRQQMPALRVAIEDLSQGKTGEGFDKLDEFGDGR
jgi:hypothetical protein